MKPLTDKQEAFCHEYLIDFNGTQAAVRAGYSKKTAKAAASRMLTNVNLCKKLSELKAQSINKLELTRERVLEEYVAVGLVNIGDIMDWDPDIGVKMKGSDQLEQHHLAAIQEVTMTETVLSHGRGDNDPDVISRRLKVKMHNKMPALDFLKRYTKLEEIGDPSDEPAVLVVPTMVDGDAWIKLGNQMRKKAKTIEHDTMKELGEN